MTERCPDCGAEAPAHYGSCSQAPAGMKAVFAALDRDAAKREAAEREAEQRRTARRAATPLAQAKSRIRKVAEGATINGTYRLSPEPALEAFRADLVRILDACP